MSLSALVLLLAAQDPPPRLTPEELIQQLANPLAALVSVPILSTFDFHVGPEREGFRHTFSAQPTVPLALGDNWNVLSRTVVPFVYQEDIAPGSGSQSGLGDVVETVYLASVEPSRRGYLWSLGATARFPTGTDDLLTQDQWQWGPSLAAVKLQDDFVFGLIATQLWDVEGSENPKDTSVTLLEPFLDYTTSDLWTLSLHVPAAYDWEADTWTVPILLSVKKLVTFQKLPVNLTFGVRYLVEGPPGGPHDLAFLFGVTLVFPK